ncbi:sensor histidine kinase [Methylocaldum marinum]|nr:PAS domain-containing sensor histidine kinase [Methylocaldum marinum]
MSSPIESEKNPMATVRSSDTVTEIKNFRELLESAPDAMLVIDPDGRIAFVNSQAEQLFGYQGRELLGRSADILIPEHFRDQPVEHGSFVSSAAAARAKDPGYDLHGLRRDGSEFPIEIGFGSVETENGILALASVRDITERKRFEDALKQKAADLEQANSAQASILAGISHELRTPLNAIIGFTGTLLMKLPGPLTAAQEKQLKIVQTSARHLLSLINDVLDITRIEVGKVEPNPEPFVCQDALREVAETLRPLAEQKNLEFELKLPPENIVVETDRRAFVQIVINLANNALKFTPEGKVIIELSPRQQDGKTMIDINVHDTGIGIKTEDQPRLFRAFSRLDAASTRHIEGTGLGLYLCQKLASFIGGSLAVKSEYGAGSTFTLTLSNR